ncbi:MAG TPA: Ldh family oxidoreductase [Firmicutes bacterium]|nr:Ldh family oxidoreductase [Bacillota bacterium]
MPVGHFEWEVLVVAHVTGEELKAFAAKVFQNLGIPAADAEVTAQILVQADLRGIDSHGVARLPIYAKRLKLGLINKQPNIKVVRDRPGAAVVDGDNGLGQVVGHKAMTLCLEKARQHGVAVVGVKNSNHFGIGAYYAMMALKEDMIGMVATNTSPLMAPFGGKEALLGTNPIAIAIPAGTQRPVVLDMATSLVPRGKIEIAARKGEKIPVGWAIDQDGRPTQEPEEALKGTLLPMGGPKGYGLALVVDILCGVLTGAAFGAHTGSLFGDLDRPQNIGHFMLAVDVNSFRPLTEFKNTMDSLILSIKNSAPAEGFKELFLPGEIEYIKTEERAQKGIDLNPVVVQNLLDLARELGIAGTGTTVETLFA